MDDSRGIKAMSEVRNALAEIGRRWPQTQKSIEQALKLLDTVEAALPRHVRTVQRRGGVGIRYAVETIDRQPVLTEYRTGGTSQPFRVGKDIYDAVIDALSLTERPLGFDDIAEAVGRACRPRPADWQMRTVLRCLLKAAPSVIIRRRSRYWPVDPVTFQRAAQANWNNLMHG